MTKRYYTMVLTRMVMLTAGVAMFAFGASAIAQTPQAANEPKTVTWTIEGYSRFRSADGQRGWLVKSLIERAYLAPGRYRDTTYDEKGNVSRVEIQDVASGKSLRLDMKQKTALVQQKQGHPIPAGYEKDPFTGIRKYAASNKAKADGQRNINGVLVNVVRYRNDILTGGQEYYEIWINANNGQLVGWSTGRTDSFDPDTDPDSGNPAEARGSGRIAGAIESHINFDAKLDASLFSLTPPAGFTVIESPTATQ